MLISTPPKIMPYLGKHCPELYLMPPWHSLHLTNTFRSYAQKGMHDLLWTVWWTGSLKNTHSPHSSTQYLPLHDSRSTMHLDFILFRVDPLTPAPWRHSRSCPSAAEKWAQPPSWCFPLEQSLRLCLGPAFYGVDACHYPQPHAACHSEQTASLLSPAFTQSTYRDSNMSGLWLLQLCS